MDAIEAINNRVMLPRVDTERRVSRDEIEELIELAVRAPNHHRTDPWRFYVVTGDALEKIAQAMADEAVEGGAEAVRAIDDARAKVARAPVIVVFTCVPDSENPKVVEAEETVSVAMAMENFLIGAFAKGLGAMLRTGPAAYHPSMRQHLDLQMNETVVGLVYLGYPVADRPRTERRPAAELTRWLGWDQ